MKRPIALTAILSLTIPAGATEWHTLGPRATAMGGAGVAVAQGAVGAYWNPAGLGQVENPSGLQIPLGAHAELTGPVLEGAKDLNEIAKFCPGGAQCTQANIDAALNKLGAAGNGLRVDGGVGADLKIKRVAVFVNNLIYGAAIPRADTVNTTPAAIAANLNNSRLTLRGISVTEIGVGYGQELPFAPGLLVGANLKGLVGRVGYYDLFVVRNDPASSKAFSDLTKGAKQSFQPGVDLGLLWDIDRAWEVPMRPRIGLTARNINNPKFAQPDQAKLAGEPNRFSLQGNARAGIAFSPFRWWNIAADADLARNLTPLDGVASQMVGVGTEINVFNRTWINIPLRAGLSRNVALKGSKTAISAGFGLNFLHATLDVAAFTSPANQEIQSQGKTEKIPSNAGVALQLGLQFGGGKEEKKAKPAPEAEEPKAEEPKPDELQKVRERSDKAHEELDKGLVPEKESPKTP